MSDSRPVVLVYTQDLFFNVRIQDVVEQLGGQACAVENAAELADGLEAVPVLAIVELGPGGEGDWIHAVRYARKSTRGIPIVAFGSHVDSTARKAARQAGCDHVWAKSRFVQELPALVERYVTPSEHTPGCGDRPSALAIRGFDLFNQGRYYECHDALEEAWFAERRACRDLYQGILQLGIALYHVERGKYTSADKMFRRALNKFQRLPAICQGIDVTELRQTTRTLSQVLYSLGPERLHEFPRSRYPVIVYPKEAITEA